MAKGHGTMRRRRVVRAAVGLGVATMAWALAAGQVRAGPDKCTVTAAAR